MSPSHAHREGAAQGEVVVGGHVADGRAGTRVQHQHRRRRAGGLGDVAQLEEARGGARAAVEEGEAAAQAQALLHLRHAPGLRTQLQ